jgi:Fe-S-cluster formation regulator IscX/YfhJ
VKRQIEQLKDFKADVDPHMVKVEALNRWAGGLVVQVHNFVEVGSRVQSRFNFVTVTVEV